MLEDGLRMLEVLFADHDERCDRINDDQAIPVLGQDRAKRLECRQWDFEAVVLIVVVVFQAVEYLFVVEEVFEQVCLVDLKDVDLFVARPAELRYFHAIN